MKLFSFHQEPKLNRVPVLKQAAVIAALFLNTMILFDGKSEAKEIDNYLSSTKSTFRHTKLLIVSVGDNESSQKYTNLKKKIGAKLNIDVEIAHFSKNTELQTLRNELTEVCKKPDTGSVIVQLPLPNPQDTAFLLDLIPPEKDIDVLSSSSRHAFSIKASFFLPPVVRAFDHFLANSNISLRNKKVAIIGKGFLVGEPLGVYLQKYVGSKVSFYDIEHEVHNHLFEEEFVISATGVPNLLSGKNFKEGTSVVDFGSSVVSGSIVGDINLKDCDHLAHVASSPGGLGPVVVRFLFTNHLRL